MTQRRRGQAATSKAAQRELQAQAEFRQEQRRRDLRDVMSTPGGRRFVWGCIQGAGTFGRTFTGTSHTFFNEGRRDVGVDLMTEVQTTCPDLYVLMLTDAMEEQRLAALQRQQADATAAANEDEDSDA